MITPGQRRGFAPRRSTDLTSEFRSLIAGARRKSAVAVVTALTLAVAGLSAPSAWADPVPSISGRVWANRNGNGTQESYEPGLPAIGVKLVGAGLDGELDTTDDVTFATRPATRRATTRSVGSPPAVTGSNSIRRLSRPARSLRAGRARSSSTWAAPSSEPSTSG